MANARRLSDRFGSEELGAVAQMGERLVCNQEVVGSIPIGSRKSLLKYEKDGFFALQPEENYF